MCSCSAAGPRGASWRAGPPRSVIGVGGLRVADASVMPIIPRVNTNLSTAAIAERVSAVIRADR